MQHRIQLSNILLMAVKGMDKKQPATKMSLANGIHINITQGNMNHTSMPISLNLQRVIIRKRTEELVF